ncbi:J domain-containing protein [Mesorhizobium australicum]|uniref:DnaJ like chaperone protein n=1 Tax=Mesorhizobium australicum TaxID=536018 RepID=A0A1X7PFF9_9HYPH|nr:DnaJ family molecular chaperone [Mesorhizobium australicum]SMH50184.1 DnaJ like chaperone protein [Mesorhizobium australicum]
MSIWSRLGDFVSRVSGTAFSGVIEALRTVFEGDPALRRKVAFSIAMIALSAKMAKADGIVTQDEVRAFQQIFSVPAEQVRNVARLYDLAKEDIAGFEAYAAKMASLFNEDSDRAEVLEDILDGLFHIAKADGFVHEREVGFLRRTAEIFAFSEREFDRILARHTLATGANPYQVLGVPTSASLDEVRRRYRTLVSQNHPDRLIARGMPEEFIAIATRRLAAINVAFEAIEQTLARV